MKIETIKTSKGQCACGSWTDVTRRHGYSICARCYELDYKTERQLTSGVSEDYNYFTNDIDEYLVSENIGEEGGEK